MTNLVCSLVIGALFLTYPANAQDNETELLIHNEVYTPLFVNVQENQCPDHQHAQGEYDGLLFHLEDAQDDSNRNLLNLNDELVQKLWDLSELFNKKTDEEEARRK